MKVYQALAATKADRNNTHCRLTFANDSDRRRFDGGRMFQRPLLGDELTVAYAVVRAREFPGEGETPLGDLAGLAFNRDPMALSRRALEALLPHIKPYVQLVPLIFYEGDYALLNIVNVIDALDPIASDIEHFPSSGRVSRIKRHVFKPAAVHDQWIFKIPQTPARAFVTDRFVSLVNEAGLTGFDFELLWSDEPVAVADSLRS